MSRTDLTKRVSTIFEHETLKKENPCNYLRSILAKTEGETFEEKMAYIESRLDIDIKYGFNVIDLPDLSGVSIYYMPETCLNACPMIPFDKVVETIESDNELPEWFNSDWIYTNEMRNGKYMTRKWVNQEYENEMLGLPF